MKLFQAMVGTESFGYHDYNAFNIISVHLESLEDIVVGREFYDQEDKTAIGTEDYFRLLEDGNLDITHTLFVLQDFIIVENDIYKTVREQRANFISKYFFENVLNAATRILAVDPPELTGDKKVDEELINLDRITRILSYVNLFIAKEIGENRDIPFIEAMGLASTVNTGIIDDQIGEMTIKVDEVSKRFDYKIDQVLLKTLLRRKYLKRRS